MEVAHDSSRATGQLKPASGTHGPAIMGKRDTCPAIMGTERPALNPVDPYSPIGRYRLGPEQPAPLNVRSYDIGKPTIPDIKIIILQS